MEDFIITGNYAVAKRQAAVQMRREITWSENLLWQHLRANRLAGLHFRRQQIIDGFIVDFFCHSAKLVIEVDGSVHHKQQEYDAERSRILEVRQLHILRFTNDQIRDEITSVLQTIMTTATERLTPIFETLPFEGRVANL